MFIKKLLIKNFQSHKSSSIEFDKGLNCVVGSTNSGKSAVIRALKFIMFGEPWEKSFVRKGHETSTINMQIGDHSVERVKGDETNEYTLDKIKYQNFGVSVPADIRNALRLNTIEFDGDTINLNFADQLDSLFLIDESDTIKAKLLNKLSGLDIIDNVMKGISDDKRACSSEIKALTKDNEETKEILKQYKDIDTKRKTIYELDIMTGEFEHEYLRIDKLYKIRDELVIWKKQKAEAKCLEEKLLILEKMDVDKLTEKLDKAYEINSTLQSVLEEKDGLEEAEKDISELEEKIKQYSKIDIDKIESMFEDYEAMDESIILIIDGKEDVDSKKEEVKTLETRYEKKEEQYKTMLDEYKDALKESKTCPTCGTQMTKEAIEKCLNSL